MSEFLTFILLTCPIAGIDTNDCKKVYDSCYERVISDRLIQNTDEFCTSVLSRYVLGSIGIDYLKGRN